MDKSLFVAMGSQRNSLKALEILSNNLANANTPGFRADYEVVKQNHLSEQDKMETRVYPSIGSSYTDFKPGPMLQTGRDLDVAIHGSGMIAVQSRSGKEGYTRAGNLEVSPDGVLMTAKGEYVLGANGIITLPKNERVKIGQDGIVSIKPLGEIDMVPLTKMKLVNPSINQLQKGEDGLFYLKAEGSVEADPDVKLTAGSLEGSNVNTVETLIKLIDISREYEIHSNFIKNLSDQSIAANKLLDAKA